MFIGLNKGLYQASACLARQVGRGLDYEVVLKERLTRTKVDGGRPEELLGSYLSQIDFDALKVAESGFGLHPAEIERRYEQEFPYTAALKKRGLDHFSSLTNPNIQFLPHHYCHALSSVAVSPFERSIIVVFDAAGSMAGSFDRAHPELVRFPPKARNQSESLTVYLQDREKLTCIRKHWQAFRRIPEDQHGPDRVLSDGIGMFYENAARYIFNSIHESGKVMGLAPFGRAQRVENRARFFEGLSWKEAFRGRGKKAWEGSGRFELFADLAATVQAHFEESVFQLLREIRSEHPDENRVILTGGCALNCTFNSRLADSGLFDEIYISPFPGDEGISLGAAAHLAFLESRIPWNPTPWSEQRSNFGPAASVPTERAIRSEFASFQVDRPADLSSEIAQLLMKGKLIAWFQGRSETGPRALGFRSLLASPLKKGIRDHLNDEIKGRESFRPYAMTCTWEDTPRFFRVPAGFESPFMSSAPKLRDSFRELFREASHVDGTSRVQTVRESQNPPFYHLLRQFETLSGFPCLLNTSLNVMGEPIVETLADARRFLERSEVDFLTAGDWLIAKKP